MLEKPSDTDSSATDSKVAVSKASEQADALALVERIAGLVRALGLHQPERTPCGQPISVSEAHALAELECGQPFSQTELGERLQLEKSTVSRLVRQLQNRGWLLRERDRSDGRAVVLYLTSAGQQAAKVLAAARVKKFSRVLDALPEQERATVLRSLDLLIKVLETEH